MIFPRTTRLLPLTGRRFERKSFGRGSSGKGFLPFALALVLLAPVASALAQPINDSLRAISLRNEKAYRLLNAMDDKGASYEFTNVTAWRITDDALRNQIIDLYTAKYGKKELKNFDIDNVYIFAVPSGTDQAGDTRFFPFHVLFMGKHVNVDTNNATEGNLFFGGGAKKNTNQTVPVAFKAQQVIPVMMHDPTLADNINAVQGDLVELPGDIMPRGVQLIKDADERYIFHEMFTGFYSKRTIIDQQDIKLGIPTTDEMNVAPDTTALQIPTEPDETQGINVESLNSQAFRYQKTIDLSIDHLTAYVTPQDALELQIGNPEVGLPFWSSGEARLWLTMRNQIGTESDFQIGFDFPNFGLGDINHGIFEPRLLSGFYGASVAAYFAGIDFFSAFNMPIAFNFSVFPAGGANSTIIYNGVGGAVPTPVAGGPSNVPADRTFYRTAFIGQMYIPFIVQLDPANFVQFSAGIGIQTVKLSWIPANDSEAEAYGYGSGNGGTVQDLTYNGKANVSTPFTPHVAIDYVNHRANKFGLDFQYDHLFTFGGWLELIPDHLRIEASYTAPLVRAALPYEPPFFFEITPRLYF